MGKSGFLGILMRPIQKVGRPSSPNIRVTLEFYPIQCKLTYWCAREEMLQDQWKMMTFIYYLARYLQISDNRQRKVMAEHLVTLFDAFKDEDMFSLTEQTYEKVFQTLSESEKKAAIGLFGMTPPTILYMVGDEEPSGVKFSTYTYSLVASSKGMKTHLDLGLADMILLPLSVSHLFTFVNGDISTRNQKQLRLMANQLLEDYYSRENQPLHWMHAAPARILEDADKEGKSTGKFSGGTPQRFAKGLAKAQVRAYKNMLLSGKLMNGDTNEDDWRAVLLTRPGYNDAIVDNIVETTKVTCKINDAPFNFQAVVIQLAAYEYQKRTGQPADEVLRELAIGVRSVLSSNIGGEAVTLN